MAVVGDEGVRNRFFVSGAFSRFPKKGLRFRSGLRIDLWYGTERWISKKEEIVWRI